MTDTEVALLAFLSVFLPHPDMLHAIGCLATGKLPSPARYRLRYFAEDLEELAESSFAPQPLPRQVDLPGTRRSARRLRDACVAWTSGTAVPPDVRAAAGELARALGVPAPEGGWAAYTTPEQRA